MAVSTRTKFQLAGDMFQALCQMREFLRPAFHHAMVEKCRFNSSAISRCSVTVCSAILNSELFPTLFECHEESSLIKCHVFLVFNLLSSRLSIKYSRLAFLISLFIWFRARLYIESMLTVYGPTWLSFLRSLACAFHGADCQLSIRPFCCQPV